MSGTQFNSNVQAMLDAHWVISPNNIHGVKGELMYPSYQKMKRPPVMHEVQVLHDRVRVFKTILRGEPYTKRSWHDLETVGLFASVDEFLAWCEEHGEEGPPPGPNVWD